MNLNKAMAKSKSIVKLSGTMGGVTFVNSKAYGEHTRAPRGTYTPVVLAEGMQQSSMLQKQANLMAKIVFDQAKTFVPRFKNGQLWVRLLKVFRAVLKNGQPQSYAFLSNFQLRPDYASHRFGELRIYAKPLGDQWQPKVHFTRLGANVEGFRLRLSQVVVAPDMLSMVSVKEVVLEHFPGENLSEWVLPAELWATTFYMVQVLRLADGQPTQLLRDEAVLMLAGEGLPASL